MKTYITMGIFTGLIVFSLIFAFKNKLPSKNNGFTPMDDALRRKQYPDGYWETVAKHSGGFRLIISGLLFALVGLAVFALAVGFIVDTIKRSYKMSGSDVVILALLFGIGTPLLFAGIRSIINGIKRNLSNADYWIGESAKASRYPESEIREFGRQAVAPDSFYFSLDGQGGAQGSTGLLTRDYIMFENYTNLCVIKREDIEKVYYSECANVSNVRAGNAGGNLRIHTFSLRLAVISRQGTWCIATVQKGIADELVARLLEKHPNINTAGGRIWTEQEWFTIERALRKGDFSVPTDQ